MARLERKGRVAKKPSVKVIRPKRISTKTIYRLLVVNIIVTVLSSAVHYEKYISLYNSVLEYIKLLT